MITPVIKSGWRAAVARWMRPLINSVGEGITSFRQFSGPRSLSKSRMSWVPVPMSTVRICMGWWLVNW